MNITPHVPIYCKSPNKFIKYELRRFTISGYTQQLTGTERVAIFLDKNGKQQEMPAQVMWDNI